MYETIVDAPTLHAHLEDPGWVVVDVRFELGNPDYGRQQWSAATIPGARFADLDRDLSAQVVPGVTGRHPLPEASAFAAWLGRVGIRPSHQVVAFDHKGGAFASRLWWMLRWVGHRAVAVLDGGWPAWTDGDRPIAPGAVVAPDDATPYPVAPSSASLVDVAAVAAAGDDTVLLDARAADRYRGINETTDPVAGHIPGAISAPFALNLGPDGRLLSPQALRTRFAALLGGRDSARAICYCGSGVTACHDILAMTHAGLDAPRLYPGSWSEWIVDAGRPVATGPDPQ